MNRPRLLLQEVIQEAHEAISFLDTGDSIAASAAAFSASELLDQARTEINRLANATRALARCPKCQRVITIGGGWGDGTEFTGANLEPITCDDCDPAAMERMAHRINMQLR